MPCNNKILAWTACMLILVSSVCHADAPKELGGFRLGSDIAGYRNQVVMETAMPIRYAEWITEVESIASEGFKPGLIAYGTCADPGKIVRIKLKYADDSRQFFDALVREIEKKYGKPAEWRGDTFGIVISWKWSFVDKQNNRISMILQHNKLDTDEKIGNSIKLTMTGQVEKERDCFQKKYPNFREGGANLPSAEIPTKDWDRFLPR